MKLTVKFTGQFKRDLKRAKKQHKDIEKLLFVIDQLSNQKKLAKKYKDHNLTGKYSHCRECHIEPDWLLIYEVYDDVLVLLLNRVGSHSELF